MDFDYEYEGVGLKLTCNACPEQYDAYQYGGVVGYFRLRHGTFTVDDTMNNVEVYRAHPTGDGIFEYEEREYYLNRGIEALIESLENNSK